MALTLAEANSIVDAAIAKARQLNVTVSVAVCDELGHLIALNRMDGAYVDVNRLSIGKAVESAGTGLRSTCSAMASASFHLWLGAGLGDCAFSISARHKLKNVLMMIGTIGPLELAGLAATYASTCRTRSVSVELARHRWKAVLTG